MAAKRVKAGLVGFGTIGRTVAESIRDGRAGATDLVAILVRDPAKVPAVAATAGARVLTDRAEFLALDMDIVVEAGGHEALRQHAEAILRAGKDLVTVSVGAFADEAFWQQVQRVAAESGRQVLVPSGAIAGLDAISAAALADIAEVTHVTRKHPRAFTPEQLQGDPPEREPRLLFDGPAQQGVLLFPENVNVAAAVSLAGIGLARTRLQVYADPTVERNTHEVVMRGHVGDLRILIQNIPTDNPKTGRIVGLSVAKALRNRSAPIVIGL